MDDLLLSPEHVENSLPSRRKKITIKEPQTLKLCTYYFQHKGTTFRQWKIAFRREMNSNSAHLGPVVPWLQEVDKARLVGLGSF